MQITKATELAKLATDELDNKLHARVLKQREGIIKAINERSDWLIEKIKNDINYNFIRVDDKQVTVFGLDEENKKFFKENEFIVKEVSPGGGGQFHYLITW